MRFREHVRLARKNYRTTLAGLGAITAAVSDICIQISTRDWDATRLGADVTGLITGLGLLFARDGVVSENAHAIDRAAIVTNAAKIEMVEDTK